MGEMKRLKGISVIIVGIIMSDICAVHWSTWAISALPFTVYLKNMYAEGRVKKKNHDFHSVF
jgi:hypothetical protein